MSILWVLHSTEVAILLLTQRLWVGFLALPKIYFDVAEICRWCWLEEVDLSLKKC